MFIVYTQHEGTSLYNDITSLAEFLHHRFGISAAKEICNEMMFSDKECYFYEADGVLVCRVLEGDEKKGLNNPYWRMRIVLEQRLESLVGLASISRKTCELLEKGADVITVGMLQTVTEKELLEIRGIGLQRIRTIKNFLDYFGCRLKEKDETFIYRSERYLSSRSVKWSINPAWFTTSVEEAGFSINFIKQLKGYGINTLGELEEKAADINWTRLELEKFVKSLKNRVQY